LLDCLGWVAADATAASRFTPDHAEANHENAEQEQDGDPDEGEDAEREQAEPEVATERPHRAQKSGRAG
jgi:hypothetical protein